MLVEGEMNNSTGVEMENHYKTEKGDYANEIKKGIRFFK